MRISTKMLAALVIASAAVVTAVPAHATHHGRTHHRWHASAPNQGQYPNWGYSPQYSLCGGPCRPGQIDPSRPGGLDASFTPRAK